MRTLVVFCVEVDKSCAHHLRLVVKCALNGASDESVRDRALRSLGKLGCKKVVFNLVERDAHSGDSDERKVRQLAFGEFEGPSRVWTGRAADRASRLELSPLATPWREVGAFSFWTASGGSRWEWAFSGPEPHNFRALWPSVYRWVSSRTEIRTGLDARPRAAVLAAYRQADQPSLRGSPA